VSQIGPVPLRQGQDFGHFFGSYIHAAQISPRYATLTSSIVFRDPRVSSDANNGKWPRVAFCTQCGYGGTMEIKRIGSQPSNKGPADWFTGAVRVDPLFQASAPARVAGASVTFEPGSRTAWHTHPLGQTLIVTAGCGRAQREGGAIEEIHPGDVVWFQPGEKHWHGASPTTAMTHIAIQEQLDGKVVEWLEKVTDEQYGAS
jgi:quercetin dioxygenase-like cupin family protein